MYKNEKLKEALEEQGKRYSPYLFRQHLPFMVLDRIYLSNHLNFPLSCQFSLEAVISYTIRSVRDIKCAPKAYQKELQEIWTPGLKAFNIALDAFIAEPIEAQNDLVTAVHKKLIQLGFDPLTMSYHDKNDMGTENEHPVLRELSREIKAILEGSFMPNYKEKLKQKAIFKQSHINRIIQNLKSIDLAACLKSMRESVDNSGRYLTLIYFLPFVKHYEIPNELKIAMEEALVKKDFQADVLNSLAEYMHPLTNLQSDSPEMIECTQLFK